uniref:Endonuclease n=1 Tax=Heterobasidion irregulare TaxID=984962 RepID=A0A075DDG9_9AGAM|nr:endonuclease [Heterobasidion irregulare]
MSADKKFMSMFMGIVDGDGYLEIGPQKQYNKINNAKSTIRSRLVIRMHNRDKSLLIYLTTVLGVGSLSSLDSINQTRLIFTKKDLVYVIIPLIKFYNLQFLTVNRARQFALLNHILENNLIHWNDVKFTPPITIYSSDDILKLDFFGNWLVGFTIAEGSFFFKANGSAYYQIKQKGIENYAIIKAICLLIADREAKAIKADSADCYQLSLSSRIDVQKVVDFFSSPDNHPLYGYKLEQYNLWLLSLKRSSRYKNIKIIN